MEGGEIMQRKDISTKIILDACEAFFSRTDERIPLEIIIAKTGAPAKVVYAALEREYNKGNIECGVSIRIPWLTDKGKKEREK